MYWMAFPGWSGVVLFTSYVRVGDVSQSNRHVNGTRSARMGHPMKLFSAVLFVMVVLQLVETNNKTSLWACNVVEDDAEQSSS
mmetsp:Transcript_29588/g.71522  ORF Transcript_29588/g.71522 Transcript_29588/m.71522 type:complete len:83 (+) Transcript_29588:2582-2830(+)